MRGSFWMAFSSVTLLFCLLASPTQASAQTAADSAAITQAALDYIDGFYAGDEARMERAFHPDLAKRIVNTNPNNGRSSLGQMSAMTLVQITRAKPADPEDQWVDDVTILDIFENVASVRVDAATWVDYLHIARWNGEWKIVNVLWEMRPRG